MSEDRVTVLEQRVDALQREVAALRAALRPPERTPYVSSNPNDPLEGHPLLSKKRSPNEAAEYEARRLKELGIDHLQPIGAERLQQLLIEDGLDPNGTEFSRGIIEMREE
jgi:hypothetical protein